MADAGGEEHTEGLAVRVRPPTDHVGQSPEGTTPFPYDGTSLITDSTSHRHRRRTFRYSPSSIAGSDSVRCPPHHPRTGDTGRPGVCAPTETDITMRMGESAWSTVSRPHPMPTKSGRPFLPSPAVSRET